MTRIVHSNNSNMQMSDADQSAWFGAGLWIAPLAAVVALLANLGAISQLAPALLAAGDSALSGVVSGAAPTPGFVPSLVLEVSFGLLTGAVVARLRARDFVWDRWTTSLFEALFTREAFSPGPSFLPLLLTNTLVGASIAAVMATLGPLTDLGSDTAFAVLASGGGGGDAPGGVAAFCAIVLLCVLLATLVSVVVHGLVAWPAILIGAARGATHGSVVEAYCGQQDSTARRLLAGLTHGAAAGALQGVIVGVVVAAATVLLTAPEITFGAVAPVIVASLWLLVFALVAHENPKMIKEGAQTLGCCLLYLIVGGFLVSLLPR